MSSKSSKVSQADRKFSYMKLDVGIIHELSLHLASLRKSYVYKIIGTYAFALYL